MPPAGEATMMPYDDPYPRGRGDGTVYDRLNVPGPREQLTFDMLRSKGPLLALMPQETEDSLITPGTASLPTRQDPLRFPIRVDPTFGELIAPRRQLRASHAAAAALEDRSSSVKKKPHERYQDVFVLNT